MEKARKRLVRGKCQTTESAAPRVGTEWQTIRFPGRMPAMGLVMHASVENAKFVFQAEELG